MSAGRPNIKNGRYNYHPIGTMGSAIAYEMMGSQDRIMGIISHLGDLMGSRDIRDVEFGPNPYYRALQSTSISLRPTPFSTVPSIIMRFPLSRTTRSTIALTCLQPSTPTASIPSSRLACTLLSHTSTTTLSLSPIVATVRPGSSCSSW